MKKWTTILVVGVLLFLTPSVVSAAISVGDTVRVITNLNVRTGAGTSYPEITDPDYPGYAPVGTLGKVLQGPVSANGYIWWKVDFGPGLYTGWSVQGGLEKVQTVPEPPTPTYPGSSSSPGPEIGTLTPTLQWQGVSNADYYALAISKYPYGSGNIVYNPQQVYGTSHSVPSGKLEHGKKYRWNMQAHNSVGWSAVSSTLYFQTYTPDVTLTLYVHEGSASGPIIVGARVTGQDGAGNSFDKTTNSSGYVIITGTPGTWQFTASKSCYQTNSWSQSITATSTKHAYLIKPAPEPPTPLSPGSSSAPGPTIGTLTPTLQWAGASCADYYALAISKYPYGSGNIVCNPQQVYGTSHNVPVGKLEYGKRYRWNMQAHNSSGWSAVSSALYFQAPPPPAVTLTLYVHEGSASGPVIPGARVTGQDGAGNSFDKTTNSSGYVTITGAPSGSNWQFTASKSSYYTNSWSQSITVTCTKDAFLEVVPAEMCVVLDVPYIHQCYDTNDSFVGTWACAPTSAVMVLAYYRRVLPEPIWVSYPLPGHYSDYGWYISSEYTYGSNTFSTEHTENTGCGEATGKGAWGYIWKDSTSSCVSCGVITNLQEYLRLHDFTVSYAHYDESAARDLVQQEINNGKPLIARTYLTGSGHYAVVVGYEVDTDGNFWYNINDTFGDEPYGDDCWGDYGVQQPVSYLYSEMGLDDPTRGLITISPVTPTCVKPLAGDVDDDGRVDFTDLKTMGFNWLELRFPQEPPIAGDLNGDDSVDFLDFAVFASDWLECGLVPRDACW